MIKDIPTSDEFDSAAKAQFDFAWDIVISFLTTLDEAGHYSGVEIQEDDKRAFWEAARQRVLTSLIIVQQGIELAIKAKIVSISPYLIIAGSHSDWPKDRTGDGISFSEFRTIDAQDLIKVHDIAHEKPFNEDFYKLFEKVRKLRNKAMHSVDSNLSVSAKEVVVILLEAHNHLYKGENWASTRREFLYNSPAAQVYLDNDHINGLVAKEFLTIFKLLTPSQAAHLFEVDKKQRLYICPACSYETNKYELIEPRYAVLSPNAPTSTELYCFVCNEAHPVTRMNCETDECRGNVISDEYGSCCTCGSDQTCKDANGSSIATRFK